jgi:predicted  nucleic acid-binding Zn-ribbon protein
VRKFVYKSLNQLLDKLEEQLKELEKELGELSSNRSYTFIEAESVKTAELWLDFVIQRVMGLAMEHSELPDDVFEKLIRIRDKANELHEFINRNFADIWNKDYSFKAQ